MKQQINGSVERQAPAVNGIAASIVKRSTHLYKKNAGTVMSFDYKQFGCMWMGSIIAELGAT